AGLLFLAALYLGASAAVQAMTFLYVYLAATVAHGVLSRLRVRLYAHVQELPVSAIDRMSIGDLVSRCTSDVEALETVFSSGIAVLVANLVRLLTLTVGMAVLSPPLTLVAALVAPPLVVTLRFLEVRVRQSERATRVAVGALTARLQESLRGIEVIRAFAREAEAVGGFRRVLGGALAASNRATRYSALYTPVTAILSALAVAALLWAGTRETFAAFGITLSVDAGEHVALVGRTGVGKTSALQLLAGLYAPWTGTVRIADRDPASLAEAERRKLLGVVPQVVQLFSGTIYDNLTLGDASVAEEAVFAAARIAGLDAFVQTLPAGYRTFLGHSTDTRGTQLSA